MGKGDRKPVRWAKNRERKKQDRLKRRAETKGKARKGK
jgi:hypothetical protein